MNLKIQILDEISEKDYTNHLLSIEHSLFFSSLSYKKLLEKLLRCNSFYIIAYDDEKIMGSFPLMIKKTASGSIANSLPFYGSNGCFNLNPELNELDKKLVMSEIIKEVYTVIENNKCSASTFITSPFDNSEWYDENLTYDTKDYRIGQITTIPDYSDSIENDLLSIFEDTRQRNIKKAIKSEVKIERDFSNEYLDFLFETHVENMVKINGKAKEKDFFYTLIRMLNQNEYAIYAATIKDEPVAVLLLFYFNRTIEYITPVIKEEFRNLQPLSYIIYRAMIEGAKNGFKYWNWGGTWKTQEGVHSFKKKWGAQDMPYYYYTKIFDKNFLNLSKETLSRDFPYFYAFPF